MQKIQKADFQRVMNLVDLYRTKVGKESQIAKDAKADCEYWDKESVDMMMEEGLAVGGGMYGEGPHTEIWIKHLSVNEQLLGHFYAEVAGEKAEKVVLDQLLPDVYDKTIFTEEEEIFLKLHFKDMVNYIILTPCDESVKWVHRHDGKDAFTIPSEVLDLISSRVKMASGSKVYYPNTAFAQLANLFEGSTFYVDTMFYAWTRVAIYANSVDAKELDDNSMPQSYDAIVSYLPTISEDSKTIKHICEAYNKLSTGGKLILLCPSGLLVEDTNSSYRSTLTETLKFKDASFIQEELDSDKITEDICAAFRRLLVEGQAIKEIVQLPQIMSNNASSSTYCLLIAEKGYADDATLIDARTASNDIDTKHHMLSFNMAKFNAILENDGKDPNTGLRKVVKVSTEKLSQHLLIPEVYTIERPSETEHPIPLSSFCMLDCALVRDVQFDLPEDTPWITMSDLTPLFTGEMNLSDIRKADCSNNPPFVEGSKDYAFGKDGKFVDSIWVQMNTKKGHHVLEYRQCTFLDGNSDAVLYERSDKNGVQIAVVRAMGKPYVVSKGIHVFCPKNSIDVNSLAALLRLPIVYRQLAAYEKYGIEPHLDDILAPTDKRVIGDELFRMKKEESVTNELGDKVQAMKTEYINEVEKFGVWKDIGFRITGTAVQSYTYMFAEFWDAFSKDPVPKKMLVKSGYDEAPDETNGYILPYYDSPMRDEPASNVLFTEFLSMATDYVWFYTPYLMLGDALFDAFIRAAKRGVDVRIIMPGIPDKKMVFRLGRSYYKDLLAAGVKIYEYEPGFVHAKAVLMDGKICGIGTVNLDYRSLFLHFECYSLFYKADIYESLKKDYLETLKKCRVMSIEDVQKGRLGMLWDGILRIAAPLL